MPDLEIPELVAIIVEDTRTRVETQVRALGTDVAERLVELGSAIQSSLIAVGVTIVTAMLFGFAVAATLTELGVPLFAALWIVTALSGGGVGVLVHRARRSGRRVIAPLWPARPAAGRADDPQ